MSEFVITYPAFFLLNEHDTPEIVEVDGVLCVCLFTDTDLVTTFARQKYGQAPRPPRAIATSSRDELLRILRVWHAAFEECDVRCVAYDVSMRRRPLYGKLTALVAMLEAESR